MTLRRGRNVHASKEGRAEMPKKGADKRNEETCVERSVGERWDTQGTKGVT